MEVVEGLDKHHIKEETCSSFGAWFGIFVCWCLDVWNIARGVRLRQILVAVVGSNQEPMVETICIHICDLFYKFREW